MATPDPYHSYDHKGLPVELTAWDEESTKELKAEIEMSLESFTCKVKNPWAKVRRNGQSANKKPIWGFSMSSAKYLRKILSMVTRGDHPFMISLTMPQIVGSRKFKKYLQKFADYFRKRHPSYAVIWKLEFQKRGAAHFHLLVWGDDLFQLMGVPPADEEHWSWNWTCILKDDLTPEQYYNTVKHGLKVSEPSNPEGQEAIKNYILSITKKSAHHLKNNQTRSDIHTGRYWGIWRKSKLNLAIMNTANSCQRKFYQFRRVYRKYHLALAKKLGYATSKGTKALQRHLKKQNPGSFTGYWYISRTERLCDLLGINWVIKKC